MSPTTIFSSIAHVRRVAWAALLPVLAMGLAGAEPAMHAMSARPTVATSRAPIIPARTHHVRGAGGSHAPLHPMTGAATMAVTTQVTSGGAVSAAGGRHDQAAYFVVANTGTTEGRILVSAQCSGSGIVATACEPGVREVYLQPGESAPVRVTFTASAAGGTGSVVLTASGAASGSTASSASDAVTAAVAASAIVTVPTFQAGPNVELSECPTVAAFTGVAVQCGGLRVAHVLPAVTRFGKTYAPTLAYSTSRIVSASLLIDVERPATSAPYTAVQASVYHPSPAGVRDPASPVWQRAYTGSEWDAAPSRRLATWDIGGENKQLTRYEVVVEVQTAAGPQSPVSVQGTVIPVHRRGSAVGNGWSLLGLEELSPGQPDGSVVWIGGDGSTRQYVPRAPGDSVYLAATLERADTLIKSGVTWRRLLPNGAKVLFDAGGRHVQTVDRFARATTFAYTTSTTRDSVQSITLPGSATPAYTFAYSPAAITIASLGRTVTMARDTVNGAYINAVASITDPDGSVERFGYTDWGRDNAMYVYVDPRGTGSWYDWDDYGHTVHHGHTWLNGAVISPAFSNTTGRGAAPWMGSQDRTQADYTYTSPRTDLTATTSFWTDAQGAVTRVTDAAGNATTVEHGDPRFPLLATRVISPNGFETRASYNAGGRLMSSTQVNPYGDGRDATTTYAWDAKWDAPTRVTSPEGAITLTQINSLTGNPDWVQPGLDSLRRTRFTYDANRQVSAVSEPGLPASGIGYDTLGNVSWTRTPIGFYELYDHDALGRLTTSIAVSDSAQARDSASVHLHGTRAVTTYDIAGRIDTTRTIAAGVAGPPSEVVTKSRYDAGGNLVSLARWGSPDTTHVGQVVTRWGYDPLGRQVVDTAPDNQVERRSFGSAGTLDTVFTRRGYPITAVYDPMGRILTRGTPEEGSAFTYDSRGNIHTASNNLARVTREYYPNGLLKQETQEIGAFSDSVTHQYVIGYSYDLDGRRVGITYPTVLAGGTARFHYNDAGAMDTVAGPTGNKFAYLYDAAGRLTGIDYPAMSALQERRLFDADGRMIARYQRGDAYQGGIAPYRRGSGAVETDTIHSDLLHYDAMGRVLKAETLVDSIVSAFNGLGQLIATARTQMYPGTGYQAQVEQFAYDPLGNRFRHFYSENSSEAGTERYQPGVGRHVRTEHVALGADTMSYDPGGNLIGQILPRVYADNNQHDVEVRDSSVFAYDWDNHQVNHIRTLGYAGARHDFPPMQGKERDVARYDALGRRVWTRTFIGESGCGTLCDDQSSVVRYVWDGSQLLGEIRARGHENATGAEMENDHPTMAYGTRSTCIVIVEGCGTTTDSTYSPYLGRVSYLHGVEGPDHPLLVMRYDYGTSGVLVSFPIYPFENWRGMVDQVADASGRATMNGTNSGPVVELPAQNALAYYNQAAPPAGPRSWNGSLLDQQRDMSRLIYMRNRYYNPETGKFTQEDPIGIAGGINTYGFANGDPVNFSDPFGLCPVTKEHPEPCPVSFFGISLNAAYGWGGTAGGGVYWTKEGAGVYGRYGVIPVGVDISAGTEGGASDSEAAFGGWSYGACGGVNIVNGCQSSNADGTTTSGGGAVGPSEILVSGHIELSNTKMSGNLIRFPRPRTDTVPTMAPRDVTQVKKRTP